VNIDKMNISKASQLEIIFEDESIIAINKPSGLLTIPDRYNHLLSSVYELLKAKYHNIFTVHRLDVGTSGILLFAKTPQAHSHLNEQFSNHQIKKIYTAVLEGVLHQNTQEIDIPLLTNPNKKGGVIPSARGKASLTILNVIERFRNATLVSAELKTGRLHQLRAHAAAIGYPLLVDDFYGNCKEFYVSSIKRHFRIKKNEHELPLISRPTMHATEISFINTTGKDVVLRAEFPKDFSALIQILSKYSKLS
jgi:23S rRNA pseudouridine955/2504/2580 synthase/23S rRNA pseudouridine1911/1915/1917 synthase